MNPPLPPENQSHQSVNGLIDKAMSEKTLPAIEEAFVHLQRWLRKHPGDYIMRDAGEPLAMLEDAIRIIEAEKSVNQCV